MTTNYIDRWKSPEFKAVRFQFAEVLGDIGARDDLSAEEKSVLMKDFAVSFFVQHDIGERYDATLNPDGCRCRLWLDYILKSNLRSITAPTSPDAEENEILASVDRSKLFELPKFTADEAVALLEDDDVMDAMAEKYGSAAGVMMH